MTRAFTPEQREAIARRDGDLMLSANAGSGKTSVLVERFVASVVQDGLRADQVLAITFTDKAAGELRARVRARLLELDHRQAAREAEAAWITTFHGFCARILRAHAVAAGLDPGFAVLDPADGRAARR
jgi:ATP-dependent helicase/nuclease subunit A